MNVRKPDRWQVIIAAIDWANPMRFWDFPTEVAARRFADGVASRHPGLRVVVAPALII